MSPTLSTWQRFFFGWASFLGVVAFFYWARAVLIPLVLATLITLGLSPFVSYLQRKGLGRIFSALLVVTVTVAAVAGILLGMLLQLRGLAVELPEHKDEIARKIVSIQEAGKGTWLDSITETVRYINERVNVGTGQQGNQPIPVRVESSRIPAVLEQGFSPALEGLITAALVIVLVAFMLIHLEKLRNRFLRLLADGNLSSATRAVDDVVGRISRFLLMQLVINVGFGAVLAVGFHLMGIPYAFLWGFLASALRYIPFIGSLIAGVLPVLVSIALLPGWARPLMAGGYVVVLELVTANVVEPLLYGQSLGVSEVALLISAAFWAWLWGPIGLMLSTPIMACLAVLGRYVPHFEFFEVLIGQSQVLDTFVSYYQRLLARDAFEAAELLEKYRETHSPDKAIEDVLVPAMAMAQENCDRGELDNAEQEFVLATTRTLAEEVLAPTAEQAESSVAPNENENAEKSVVLGCPARDGNDELALELFGKLAASQKFHLVVASPTLLFGEIITKAKEMNAGVVLIASLSRSGLAQARYLCKRLRSQMRDLKILIACWSPDQQPDNVRLQLQAAGADRVSTTLAETAEQLNPLAQFLAHAAAAVAQ